MGRGHRRAGRRRSRPWARPGGLRPGIRVRPAGRHGRGRYGRSRNGRGGIHGAAVGARHPHGGTRARIARARAGAGPLRPLLAAPSAATAGQAIDGIGCSTSEQTLFHIHTHLTIFVDGKTAGQVPAGIGIPGAVAAPTPPGPFAGSGRCFYWLHTHAADGIIHIESPVKRAYTLGDFFDEWRQPLGPDRAGPARGKVTVIVNGRVFAGNPRDAPLGSRENLQTRRRHPPDRTGEPPTGPSPALISALALATSLVSSGQTGCRGRRAGTILGGHGGPATAVHDS